MARTVYGLYDKKEKTMVSLFDSTLGAQVHLDRIIARSLKQMDQKHGGIAYRDPSEYTIVTLTI